MSESSLKIERVQSSPSKVIITVVLSGLVLLGVIMVITAGNSGKSANVVEEEQQQSKSLLSPLEVAESFTQATDSMERLRWCRFSEEVAALLPSLPEQALSEVPVSIKPMGRVTTETGLFFHRFIAEFANGDRRLLNVVDTEEGPLVDWLTYARYGSVPWSDIFAGTVEQAIVRVLIHRSNYYNGNYSDDKQWVAFSLTSPDTERTITAYAPRGGEYAKRLQRGITRKNRRVTLCLAIDSAMVKDRQCEIADLLTVGWVLNKSEP